jgi:hypothetical protein
MTMFWGVKYLLTKARRAGGLILKARSRSSPRDSRGVPAKAASMMNRARPRRVETRSR